MEKSVFFLGVVILFATLQPDVASGKRSPIEVDKPGEVKKVGDVISLQQNITYRVNSWKWVKDGFAKYKEFTAEDIGGQVFPNSFTFTKRCRGGCWDPAIGEQLKGKYRSVSIKWKMQVTPQFSGGVSFYVDLVKACTCQKRGKGRGKPKPTAISSLTST